MSLRDRVKLIFKKYGFTVFSVLTAVGGYCLQSALVKGVGNGLKLIGKKIGEILPGLVGAVASFIFKTAGEMIGFWGKNAWLLIVALVLFVIEQFKKKHKNKKCLNLSH